jgi:hypothetical protein
MPRPTVRKLYSSPSLLVLDAGAAKAKLQANGDSEDPIVQKVVSLTDEQLNPQKAKLR